MKNTLNGRHARLMANVLAQRRDRPIFAWGGADLVRAGDFRRHHMDALRATDAHDIGPPLFFARSCDWTPGMNALEQFGKIVHHTVAFAPFHICQLNRPTVVDL